jgi:4-amino-4-deoxy-L-arabinose transferase-like glycosyltransferase
VLAAWYYLVKVRTTASSWRRWALLGVLCGLSVSTKQSNLVLLPIIAALALLFPPPYLGVNGPKEARARCSPRRSQ